MSIGNLSAAGFVSSITKEAVDKGEMFYTTKVPNEVISTVKWYNENNKHKAKLNTLKINSLTIEAISDDLIIFPLLQVDNEPEFGLIIEAGTSHRLTGISFSGFMVYGPAFQSLRFYFDTF